MQLKVISVSHIEDFDSNHSANQSRIYQNKLSTKQLELLPPNIVFGFNTLATNLCNEGYKPVGDLQITYTPVYMINGDSMKLGGEPIYTQTFIKQ